jgi:DNA-binding CsgD family transcriptional regulator
MACDDDLIARIQKDCLAIPHDDVRFCRLIRHSVRKLFDHSAVVAQLQTPQAPTLIIGFDIAPRLARALRIAAHAVDRGALISRTQDEGSIVVELERLRAIPLGPRLRQLALGQLVLSAHAESEQASRSVFAFIGVRGGSTERLKRVVQAITPALHCALFNMQQERLGAALSLTPAERAICRLLLAGAHNKEIARTLKKSVATVRNQLHSLFSKLGVTTRTAAATKLRDLPTTCFAADDGKAVLIEHWPIELQQRRMYKYETYMTSALPRTVPQAAFGGTSRPPREKRFPLPP